jgi:hypothetical protein
MPPDFLLRCSVCGREAVWDTEAIPPVGEPEIGHPVLWQCDECGGERRHIVQDLAIVADKLHHEICLATETDRPTVDRVMTELGRYRERTRDTRMPGQHESTEGIEDVATATAVCREIVAQVLAAEAHWMQRRGYCAERDLGT